MDCNALSLIDGLKKAETVLQAESSRKQPCHDDEISTGHPTQVASARVMGDKIPQLLVSLTPIYRCLVPHNFSMILGSRGTFGKCKVAIAAWVHVKTNSAV